MKCEACRRASVQRENGADDASQPYALCNECNTRLEARALRPLEWFNLAAIHGLNKHLLHDDFYDEDGTAFEPEYPVESAEAFPAPTLAAASADLDRIIDFAITRWFIGDEVMAAIRAFDPNRAVDVLIHRTELASNEWVEASCYEICARALGRNAESWVRSRHDRSSRLFCAWAEAAAACMPFDEGWRLTVESLDGSKSIREDAQALGHFRTALALDWIESHLPALDLAVTEDWGRLAAISQLSWPRVSSWLELGRPLSLVALDAVTACFHYNTLNLRRMKPKLAANNLSRDEIEEVLDDYAGTDGVPRVTRAIDTIKANLNTIVNDPI